MTPSLKLGTAPTCQKRRGAVDARAGARGKARGGAPQVVRTSTAPSTTSSRCSMETKPSPPCRTRCTASSSCSDCQARRLLAPRACPWLTCHRGGCQKPAPASLDHACARLWLTACWAVPRRLPSSSMLTAQRSRCATATTTSWRRHAHAWRRATLAGACWRWSKGLQLCRRSTG